MVNSVILWNLRSAHNVGAILRTCDAFGVGEVVAVGTTPHPRVAVGMDDTSEVAGDPRLPHEIARAEKQLAKTALGAEQTVAVRYLAEDELVDWLAADGQPVIILEQGEGSIRLQEAVKSPPNHSTTDRTAASLLVGEERFGLPRELIDRILALIPGSHLVEIPMRGQKESLNVAVATGIALYALCTR